VRVTEKQLERIRLHIELGTLPDQPIGHVLRAVVAAADAQPTLREVIAMMMCNMDELARRYPYTIGSIYELSDDMRGYWVNMADKILARYTNAARTDAGGEGDGCE
jgi:hypothetical protein